MNDFKTSGFGLIDVTKGRGAMFRAFQKNKSLKIPVLIEAEITGVLSNDDGISREFELNITNVTTRSSTG